MAIDSKELDDFMPATELEWSDTAIARMKNVPFFVRKSVVRGIEQYAKDKAVALIDDDVVSRARQEREGGAIEEARKNKATKAAPASEVPEELKRRQFVNFAFYKLDPAFRRLSKERKEVAKKEFLEVLEEYDANNDMILLGYTMVGIRADVDIMFWRISYDMEDMFNPEHEEDRTHIIPGKAKYLFIYPFVKTRAWYLLTQFTRQGIMDEHIYVGNKYPSVKLNTSYSFGIDDQEFVVAFETDYPEDFVDLVMDLRETQGSLYVERDTPIFSCIANSLEDTVNSLGI